MAIIERANNSKINPWYIGGKIAGLGLLGYGGYKGYQAAKNLYNTASDAFTLYNTVEAPLVAIGQGLQNVVDVRQHVIDQIMTNPNPPVFIPGGFPGVGTYTGAFY